MKEEKGLIKYLENIDFMPISLDISLRSKKEVLDKLLVDYSLASIATYAKFSSYELIKTLLKTLDDKFEISKLFTGKDKELIINIYNKKIAPDNLEEITYKFESANVCMWALGLSDEIYYDNKCSVKKINDLLLKSFNYNELLNKSEIRNKDEIFNYYNKIAKYIYSNSELSFISAKVINIQNNAFKYILLYNFNKSGIKAIYKKEDLKFEFILPEGILFDKVSENTKELFALSSMINDTRVIVNELKNISIQDDLNRYLSMGFNIISIDYVKSIYLEDRILKVKLSKNDMIFNTYYIKINTHLIRYTSKDILLNVDSDIIFSIKVL